jgi:hypothetical protein
MKWTIRLELTPDGNPPVLPSLSTHRRPRDESIPTYCPNSQLLMAHRLETKRQPSTGRNGRTNSPAPGI